MLPLKYTMVSLIISFYIFLCSALLLALNYYQIYLENPNIIFIVYLILILIIYNISISFLAIINKMLSLRYKFREQSLLYTIGFLTSQSTIVYYRNIKGYDVFQSILHRKLDLYNVSFYVIGEKHTLLCLTGEQKDYVLNYFQKLIDNDPFKLEFKSDEAVSKVKGN